MPFKNLLKDNPEQINASSKLVEDPSNAALIDFEVKTIRNATIDDDRITFDVIVICDIEVEETIHRNREVDSICQWFIIKCQAMLSETLDEFNVQEIRTY